MDIKTTMKMRDILVQFISTNKDSLAHQQASLLTNTYKNATKGCWATHLEIFSVASLLQIPIYISTQRSKTLEYYLEMYSPQSCHSFPLHCSLDEHGLRHLKLAHIQRCHYETVKMIDGSQPENPPTLINNSYHFVSIL